MATTYSNAVQKDVVGGLMGMPPMSDPELFKEGKSDPNGTPMSQATTAPSTPYFCASLPDPFGTDSDVDEAWSRQSSPFADDSSNEVTPTSATRTGTISCFLDAITEELEEVKALAEEKNKREQTDDSEDDDDSIEWITEGKAPSTQQDSTPWTRSSGPVTMGVLEEKLDEIKNMYLEKYGQDVDSESEIDTDLIDEDGTPWICTVGTGPATMNVLQEKLEEVKTLYREKFGQDVDSESKSDGDLVDEDGTPWMCTVGTGAATMDVLEQKLEEVKTLYKEKYGQDVDSESEIEFDLLDSDGTPWMCTVGTGPATMNVLQAKLDEVKTLYMEKYGQDVDSESESDDDLLDSDGTAWMCTIGSGPATMDVLEQKLEEVKFLYKEKYGQDVDSESQDECDLLDSDGTPWICTVGSGPATMDALEKKLDEVKNLYREKFGQDADSESESDDDLVDEDGTPWMCTIGTGAATMDVLEQKLEDVKTLYKEKYGQDVDSESEIEFDLLDSDGTPWICTNGCGLATMAALEGMLDEVKTMYREKYGQDVDIESESDGDLVDEDGTPWMCTVGTGAATMDVLEQKLEEVKTLYKEKYGEDVDSESEIDCDLLDSDGTPWMRTVGTGLPTMSALKKKLHEVKHLYREEDCEDADSESDSECDLIDSDDMRALEEKLQEVKNLYREKYGQDMDNESEIECDLVDSDGTPWICTSGTGPATMGVLEKKLEEVKTLYKEKYGQDVDTESESECDLLDADGTPWIGTFGTGLATMDVLKKKLDEVKTMYMEKYGEDVDSESESDDDLVDEDGTPWIYTVGSGPVTIDVLEEKLDEVKTLYKEKYGQDVDSESESECDLLDSDGTPWVCTIGSGPATMSVLEKKLDEVKNLYWEKYGQDVDSESEDECDLVDEDGTPWMCTIGSGPATMDALEEKLEEVKTMYREKYGQDVDTESECDLLDEDGTPWMCTVGSGPATMGALEKKLEEVKSLYMEKYGEDVESESESECDLVDADGTQWMCTIGTGPATVDALEEKLDVVKNLYREKYGQDVDSESEDECDMLDSDGTPWMCTVGSGPTTMDVLEKKLHEVMNMYKEKYGEDVDSESEIECDLLDSDGTPWMCTSGTGPATMDALEKKLDELKNMYKEKYGEDLDGESEIECDLLDSDGTPWIGTFGTGPATVDVLEKKLDEVKNMYNKKYGEDVDSESEIECDLLDSDGTPWIATFGTGLATVDVLEEKLDKVKTLFREKYGQDVDASEGDLVDDDGTPWTCTAGTGLVTVALLEEKLGEVKNFYKMKYGLDIDTESDDEDAA